MFTEFEGFKKDLASKADDLKNSLENLKYRITREKFYSFSNYKVTHCPYKATFTTPYFAIPLSFDVCMVVSTLYPVIYFITFTSALYLGVKFFLKILMRI